MPLRFWFFLFLSTAVSGVQEQWIVVKVGYPSLVNKDEGSRQQRKEEVAQALLEGDTSRNIVQNYQPKHTLH